MILNDDVNVLWLKPRPHQSNNVEATGNFVEATFDFFAKNGNNVERVYRKISSFRQSRMLLWHCCRFWQQCRTKFRPFYKLETNCTCSICSSTENFFYFETALTSTSMFNLLQLCRKDRSTCSIWHSTMLLWRFCWCGLGLSVVQSGWCHLDTIPDDLHALKSWRRVSLISYTVSKMGEIRKN